jgi:transposase
MQHKIVAFYKSFLYPYSREGFTMQRLQIADAKLMEMALKNEILRSEEARYDHRLHGVLLVCQGYSCYDVGQMFGHHSTTIQRWVKSFEMHGFSGLEDQPKAGRPPRLTPGQWQLVDDHLRRSPREFGYSQNLWDGKLLAHHLEQSQKVALGVRQCQRIFHQLGFRLRKPRPVIARANLDEQEAFKKTPQTGPKKRS